MTREEQIMEYANSFEGKGVESDALKEIIRLAIIDGAKWADAHPKEPSLPSNLDEAAKEYGRNTFINECMENGVCDNHDLSDAFIAGAEWQKEQMMKDAVEGEVVKTFPEGVTSIHYLAPAGIGEMAYFCSDNGLNIGDKVRIIIVKEEDGDG